MFKIMLKRFSALVAVAAIMQSIVLPTTSYAETGENHGRGASNEGFDDQHDRSDRGDRSDRDHDSGDLVTAQPPSRDPLVARYFTPPESSPQLSMKEMSKLLRKKIKYVFVIFNENESFDHEYGTFPGVNGVYSNGRSPRSAKDTVGFTQTYIDKFSGQTVQVQPFRLGPQQNSTIQDSVDHSHPGLAAKINVVNGIPQMDKFAQDEYNNKSGSADTAAKAAKGRQFANIVMSHVDCDTIPFWWQYASRFTIFDNIFATEDTPSTPNAVALIAGQSGETQWVKPGTAGTTQALSGTVNGTNYDGKTGTTQGPPLVNDPNPYWGTEFDAMKSANGEPTSPKEFCGSSGAAYNVASNLTFASIPLTTMGTGIVKTLSGDLSPATNQADIQKDIPAIASHGTAPVGWRWYQNGFDLEPSDTNGVASHNNYVAHHQGPQYFGYIADNTLAKSNLKGEGDFFADVASQKLPPEGGIVYIRGGFGNIQKLKAPIQNPNYPAALTPTDIATLQAAKAGDDDHPSYSDHQLSEAMNARVINAIASNKELWEQSAIIITYDESDGLYDHVPPRVLSYGPDGLPLSRGIRVPLLVISPYSRVHTVSHAEGDHNAVIETINAIFNLPTLSGLPDEAAALQAGNSPAFNQYGPAGFQQKYLGPHDTNSPISDSLLSAFDTRRLLGTAPMLPASYAMIPDAELTSLPHFKGNGCSAIGITPEDVRQGIQNNIPANLNPFASTLPQYDIPAP